MGGGRAHLLLVVGDDAADKVGVGVPQRGHELGQGLLVQLAHRAEHALLGLVSGAERCVAHASHLVQAHDAVHWGGAEGGRQELQSSSLGAETYPMKGVRWDCIYTALSTQGGVGHAP